MNNGDGLPPLRAVVQKHGLAPRKSLGQNFLFDLNLTGKIARAAAPLGDCNVIEIGPGPGGLTRALLAHGAKQVVAIERDSRCIAALNEIAIHYPTQLNVIEGDALDFNIQQIVSDMQLSGPVRIIANLPYNIATALLTRWIEVSNWPPVWDRMVLMFQREVAQRIVATPLERADYGRLAVLAGWRTDAHILFDVSPSAFTPPPKVTSSIVELVPRADPLECSLEILSAITKAAFGQRRKMLRGALRSLQIGSGKIDAATLLDRAEINPQSRAEEISVEGYVRMARIAKAMLKETKNQDFV